jgi:Flp pilus assembly protein TadG
MRLPCQRLGRRGASTVEFAVTCPIAIFLIFATITGALGAFRYQQVASLAREAARWASVHGSEYERETGNPAATPEDVFNTAILPSAVALDHSKLSYSVTWNSSNEPLSVHENYETPTGNTVTVTVSYVWLPETYLAGPFTLTSTSTSQMLY